MNQRWEEISWWHWDSKAEAWSDKGSSKLYDSYIEAMGSEDQNNSLQKLKVLTYNVFCDKMRRDTLLRPDLRYRRVLDLMSRVDVDLIGLNEVNKDFLQMLVKEDWVRERFYVSDASEDADTLEGEAWGNVVLSRFPFHSLYAIALTGTPRKTMVGAVDLCVAGSMRRMCVCSVHTTAFPWNVSKRRLQMEELQHCIERELPVSFDDVIIMGDLNLRKPEEDAVIPRGYIDIWPLVRSDPGYTFDAIKNKMIPEAWPLASKKRRMRLDRILLKSKATTQNNNKKAKLEEKEEEEKEKETKRKPSSPQWVPKSMRLFGHLPVAAPLEDEEDEDEEQERKLLQYEQDREEGKIVEIEKGWMESAFDFFGMGEVKKVEDYLWPSDHYGLVTVLVPKEE